MERCFLHRWLQKLHIYDRLSMKGEPPMVSRRTTQTAVITPSAKPLIDENFISSDAGNGWAACYRMVGGKVKQHGIPHARARVTGEKLNTDLGNQNIAEY